MTHDIFTKVFFSLQQIYSISAIVLWRTYDFIQIFTVFFFYQNSTIHDGKFCAGCVYRSIEKKNLFKFWVLETEKLKSWRKTRFHFGFTARNLRKTLERNKITNSFWRNSLKGVLKFPEIRWFFFPSFSFRKTRISNLQSKYFVTSLTTTYSMSG